MKIIEPKVKARELVFKMWGKTPTNLNQELTEDNFWGIGNAINCALVAVEVILSLELREIPYKLYSGSYTSCRDYWEEIQQELEGL